MSGVRWIAPYMIASWICLSPLFTSAIFVFSLVKYKPLTYNNTYVYPWWGYMIGWMLALVSMVNIPIVFFYQLVFSAHGSLIERWNVLTTPYLPHCRSETVNAPNVLNIELGLNSNADSDGLKNDDADAPPPPYDEYGGMYIFQLFDYYAASGFVLLWVSMFESFTIGWVYGGRRFMKNVTEMSGVRWIAPYMIASWICLSPLFTSAIFVFSLVKYKPLTYNNTYVYPWWGYMIGWMLALVSMVNIPIVFFYQLIFSAHGSLIERWNVLTTPYLPHCRSETVNAPNVHVVEPSFLNIELGLNSKANSDVMENCDSDMPPPPYDESVGTQDHDAKESV
nr:uncharacterized protein LOC129263125 [Lytechinus pictus]